VKEEKNTRSNISQVQRGLSRWRRRNHLFHQIPNCRSRSEGHSGRLKGKHAQTRIQPLATALRNASSGTAVQFPSCLP